LESNSEWDRAFQLYVKAAENYIHISRKTTDQRLRSTFKTNAGKALERAEKIKASKRDLTPAAIDTFSEREWANKEYVVNLRHNDKRGSNMS
jgi:calpain-7